MTWYEAKGILDSVFKKFKIVVEYKAYEQDKRLHPGRTASLWLNNEFLGVFGQLHPQLCQELDLISTVYGFELNFEVLLQTLSQEALLTPVFKHFSSYPPIELDLAFFVSLDIPVARLIEKMKTAGGNLLKEIELFDDYRGESVPKGQRNLAFSLLYRSDERTLTDKDVITTHNRIRKTLVDQFNVTLRS
jgi:phenylalanyl-tRNA synthetase beta chain